MGARENLAGGFAFFMTIFLGVLNGFNLVSVVVGFLIWYIIGYTGLTLLGIPDAA
ncbi:MAG: hypothetical protein QMD46_08325 [Methanomicrobiales archaeon]|nr:hypothetical protein [Methanomicrobiales archaeon]MDI6876253.1 hypothetical protein [Methanomicrobiales archaeon]